jgi:CHAT domain-containing protein
LSACETALGDINGSEGVYGLQRGFRMAGVDNIIMSLWSIYDNAAAEFMEDFYKNWLSGMKLREAFNKTQKYMLNKYRNEPTKWAAFILVE